MRPQSKRAVDVSDFATGLSGECTLRFAVLDRIVSLKVPNNFLCAVVRNRCAKGFIHLDYLGFPGCGGKWRLHGNVAGTVAGVAVDANLLNANPGGEICTGRWVGSNLKVRIR